jgi:hypothetical protein
MGGRSAHSLNVPLKSAGQGLDGIPDLCPAAVQQQPVTAAQGARAENGTRTKYAALRISNRRAFRDRFLGCYSVAEPYRYFFFNTPQKQCSRRVLPAGALLYDFVLCYGLLFLDRRA